MKRNLFENLNGERWRTYGEKREAWRAGEAKADMQAVRRIWAGAIVLIVAALAAAVFK